MGVVRLQDWHGREIDAVRSRGGVWAFPDFSDNVIRSEHVRSLSLRRSPCIRKNCPACARGEGHQSYALYGRSGGRRFTIHTPERLAPEVNAAVQNGRHLQELINEAGVRYLKALKRQLQAAKPRARQKPARQRRGRSRDARPGIVSSGLCGAPGVLLLT